MDDYMMMGDDPSVYLSPPSDDIAALIPSASLLANNNNNDDDDDDDSDEEDEEEEIQNRGKRINSSRIDGESITNSTNQQMLDNKRHQQRKGNRRQQQNSNSNNRYRNRNSNNQNDGTSSFDDNNPINIISAFNRTGKIYNKLRKNDAVKVIDTPSGRAGFVYQSGNTGSSSSINSRNQEMSPSIKESNSNWEDSYSQSSQFVNRNANDVKLIPSTSDNDDPTNKKILPVLTADGKIALVVRGDTSRQIFDSESQNNGSGNSVNTKKYEPITNLTSIITALNSNNNNNNNNDNNNHNLNTKLNETINLNFDTNSELKTIQEQNRGINRIADFLDSVTKKVKNIEEKIEHQLGIDLGERDDNNEEMDEDFQVDAMTTTSTSTTTTTESSFDNENENRRDLLFRNRPLSEVLGLHRKTHYHHPHDPFHSSSSNKPDLMSNLPSDFNNRRLINTPHRTSIFPDEISTATTTIATTTTTDVSQNEEFDLESPEKINIAVIPRFDSELEERLFGKKKNNRENMSNEILPNASGAISSIHSAMQVMMVIACACTVLGVLGNYYRTPLANHFRDLYW